MDFIFKLLSQFTWETKEDIPNSYKCIKCRNIINNTKQIECGCRFCSNCVQDLIESGCESCPGVTEFCKDSSLSRAIPNYGMNRDISNIVVKCPHLCGHEDKLINMDEHLQICDKKPLKCVFGLFGCEEGNLLKENIQNHFFSEFYNHMLMLVNTMDDMETEIKRMKTKIENIENENENIRRKNENMKKENKEIKATIENMKNENENMKIENNNLGIKIENIENENENMRNLNQEQERQIDSMKNEMNLMKMGGRLVWTIDKLGVELQNKKYLQSKYFYSKIRAYKMSLLMLVNSDSRFCIYFYVWDDVRNNVNSKWPFKATVTMTIRGKEAEKSKTENIERARPSNNTFNHYEFIFEHSDVLANLLVNDRVTVECVVDEDY